MRRYGIVSYNIHGNFTNYGSVLQSFALQEAIVQHYGSEIEPIVLNYWPKAIIGRDQLNPLKGITGTTVEFQKMINDSMPAIIENYRKIQKFVASHYILSKSEYCYQNFNQSMYAERLDGYIVGSDAIWMVDFFGKDDGFWGNYDSMKSSNTIAYATSFGESSMTGERLDYLEECIKNFKAVGIRESKYFEFIKSHTNVDVKRVVDPTLLLRVSDYSRIISDRVITEPYILIYSRKYNPEMDKFADELADRYGYKVVEISLRYTNKTKHVMFYHAGIEEFLSLIKYSENVITNSLHATIFSILFHRPVSFFERENAGNKVRELFNQYKLQNMQVHSGTEPIIQKEIDFDRVDEMIEINRKSSLEFLGRALLVK